MIPPATTLPDAPPAPLALFAYMRADHLARTLDSLRANPESARTALHVFCDGARRPEHQAQVDEVRRLVDRIDGFASVTRIHRPRNLGLAASIIDGVGHVLAQHERVIVVEDDLVVSPHFLRYMNDGLDLYRDAQQVASIHAYCYPVGEALPETFFLRGADCWGWATWRRAWAHFRADGAALLAELEAAHLTHAFDLDGSYGFTEMLRAQTEGRNSSWAIRWHASTFLAGMLTLYPGRSLVHNIGHDDSGTHSGATQVYAQQVADRPVRVIPQPLEADDRARRAFARFLRQRHGGAVRRAVRTAWQLLRRTA